MQISPNVVSPFNVNILLLEPSIRPEILIFPKLCFVSPVTGYIEEEDKAAFKEEVGENTWEMVELPEVEMKFKIVEVLGQWMGQK